MRKNSFFYHIVIWCFLVTFTGVNSILAQDNEVILPPTHDSYAKGHNSGTGGPAGAEERMRVRFRDAGEWRFDAYTKFDISTLDADLVASAVVRLYTATATGGNPIDLQMQHTAPTWDEATLIASNRPQWLDPLVTIPYTGVAGWYEWEVTSVLKTLLEGEASDLSMVITPKGGGGDQDVYFHSKENPQTEYHPQLVITLIEEQPELVATNIWIDGVSLQGFDSALLAYNILLPAETVAVPAVTAVASDETATVTVTPATSLTGTELERTTTIALTRGDQMVTYTILFELEEVEPVALAAASITIGGKALEGFAAEQFNYAVILSVASPQVPPVTATANDPEASVTITPAASLTGTPEERTTTITLVRDDETVVYSIVFETALIPLVLAPTHDTYTPGHTSNAAGPFGAETRLRNRFRAAGEWRFDIYLKFDISQLVFDNLDRAVIRMYTEVATEGLPIELRMNKTGSQWSETDLVAANRPQWLEVVSTATYTGEAGWYEWDISTLLDELLTSDGEELSVVITPQGGGGQEDIYFISKENELVQYHPQLVIEFSEEQQPQDMVADDISLDGVTLTGFTPDQFIYTVILPANTPDIPVVTATSGIEGLSVVQAISLTGTQEERTALIILTRGDEEVTYSVIFELQDTSNLLNADTDVFSYTLRNGIFSFSNSGIYSHYHLFSTSGAQLSSGAVMPGSNAISIPAQTPGIVLIVLSGTTPKTIKLPVH